MSNFAGQVAVVTGAANGIGAAIAHALSDRGAVVVGLDLELVDVACETSYQVDLADVSRLQETISKINLAHERVDVLVNVAGIAPVNLLADFDSNLFERVLAVNLRAPVALMAGFAPKMTRHGYGRIVNVTSIHGKFSEPGVIAYDASKGALEAATRTASLELADAGILVNAVAPGFVNTRMSIVNGVNELESEWFKSVYREHGRLPLRRAAEPDEIAAVVTWLVSAENTYVTGQTLLADGGLSARF